jgi:hypothetical protein
LRNGYRCTKKTIFLRQAILRQIAVAEQKQGVESSLSFTPTKMSKPIND